MKKRQIDNTSKRKVFTFFYPFSQLSDLLMKETAYRVKLIVESGQAVPQSLVFHDKDDRFWLESEIRTILTSLTSVFLKMSYGIDPEIALFFNKKIDGEVSAGFSVNDYGRVQPGMPKWIDEQMRASIVYGLCSRWFSEKGQGETSAMYENLMVRHGASTHDALKMFKRKRKQLMYPEKDSEFWGDDYNMKPMLDEFLNPEENAATEN